MTTNLLLAELDKAREQHRLSREIVKIAERNLDTADDWSMLASSLEAQSQRAHQVALIKHQMEAELKWMVA